jgi:hypothetical protein
VIASRPLRKPVRAVVASSLVASREASPFAKGVLKYNRCVFSPGRESAVLAKLGQTRAPPRIGIALSACAMFEPESLATEADCVRSLRLNGIQSLFGVAGFCRLSR